MRPDALQPRVQRSNLLYEVLEAKSAWEARVLQIFAAWVIFWKGLFRLAQLDLK